jgi:Ca-activated chloride channel family protein
MGLSSAERAAISGALLVSLSALALAQQPTFRAGTQVVSLFATVTDAQKRLVPDLMQSDFEVLDNEKSQQLVFFQNEIQPISVVVMLDTSGSMTMTLDLLRAAAEQFVLRLLPADKARVGAFNDKIQLKGRGFMNDRDQLVTDIKDLDFGNGTRLWDAIAVSEDELKGIDGRKIVLVFTDGDDTDSRSSSLGKVIDKARVDEIMIYAIGFESHYFNGQRTVTTKPDSGLRKIADETGGGYFELKKTADLAPTFTKVASELHSQYVIGFSPTLLDNRVHKLAVKMKPAGLTARARKSYVAAAAKISMNR